MNTSDNSTSIMLSLCYIDSGINYANELEVIFQHLQNHPEEFDRAIALRLTRITGIIKACLYDCYQNHPDNKFSYDDILTETPSGEITTDIAA